MKELCDGTLNICVDEPKNKEYERGSELNNIRPTGVKRIRLTCPKCKRRLMSSVRMGHDNDGVLHYIPKHKPKKWWKKRG